VLGHDEGLVVSAESNGHGYDGPVTAQHRRAAAPLRPTERRRLAVPLTLAIFTALAVGCGGTTPASTVSPSLGQASAEAPSLTPVPGGSNAASPAGSVSQTDTKTAIGRIWDSLPPSFPRLPGATPIETGSGPTSGTFAVGSNVADAVAAIKGGLTAQGLTVDAGSPLEDGSVVLVANGGVNPACRIEVRFTPLSGTTTMAVLYGASCPFG
jgi:hypothetical protein